MNLSIQKRRVAEFFRNIPFTSDLIITVLLILRFIEGWITQFVEIDIFKVQDYIGFISLCLTCWFILINRNVLGKYNFEKVSVLLILFFSPLRTLLLPLIAPNLKSPASFPNLLSWATITICVLTFFYIRPTINSHRKQKNTIVKWLAISCLLGMCLNFLFGLIITLQNPPTSVYSGKIDYSVFLNFPYQLGYASAYEEPIFRGILLGRYSNCSKMNFFFANLLQALFFAIAHGTHVLSSVSILPILSIFISGIIYGFLVKSSKSIATSMVAHATYNGFGFFTSIILFSLYN